MFDIEESILTVKIFLCKKIWNKNKTSPWAPALLFILYFFI